MITIEDYNSIMQTYALHNKYHHIDTSLVSLDEFTDVSIDFVNITHSISSGTHTFDFTIVNTAWTGGYYLLDGNGDYIDDDATYSGGVLTYSTTDDSITLVLHCSNLASSFNLDRLTEILLTENVSYGTHPSKYVFEDIVTGETSEVAITGDDWLVSLGHNHYAIRFFEKAKANFNFTDKTLIAGKQNYLNISTDDVDCIVSYLNTSFDYNPYTDGQLLIDLKGIYDITSINLKIRVKGNATYIGEDISAKIRVVPVVVSTANELVSEINAGASEIHLAEDITLDTQVIVNTNLILFGEQYLLDLNNYSISIRENVIFKTRDLTLVNGNPCIMQGKGSTVDLNNCIFENCSHTESNNLGSVIYCDIDIASLDVTDDYTTSITNCYFHNNHNCILHGGTLNIDNTRYHNTDMTLTDVNNPAFLYQVDGEADIRNSVFDIDYHESTDYDESNIMYAQAVFVCGETAVINNATYTDMNRDDNLNWFNNPYNNQTHTYLRYYYSALEEVVYTSPVLNFEDKCICYAVSGVDWVFKKNIQITKASDETQNTIRKITWED